MNRHSRFAILMAVCAAVSSCGGGGGGAGTSIATSAGTAAFGQPVTDMAGIYELYDTVGIAHGLIDDQGHVIVISQTHAGDPALNLQQFVDFSGVATSTGAGTWSMQNALVYSEDRSGSNQTTISTANATISGSHAPGQSVTFSVPSPPAPALYRGNFTMVPASFNGPSVPMADLAGKYHGQFCSGTPVHPGTCDPATDYTLDANGQLQGRLTPACDFTGTAAVAANRNVVRATGTLTGPGCPGTTTVLGYIFDLGASKHGLTWWYVQANGQPQSTSANQL